MLGNYRFRTKINDIVNIIVFIEKNQNFFKSVSLRSIILISKWYQKTDIIDINYQIKNGKGIP